MMTLSKKILIFLILISAIFFVFISICLSKQSVLSDLTIREEEADSIKKQRALDENLNIKNIYFNNEPLIFDKKTSKNWYYSLILNSDKKYNPEVKYVAERNIKVAFLNASINQNSIKNNIPLDFIIYTKDKYNIQHVYTTTLPLMSIDNGKIYIFDNAEGKNGRIYTSYVEIKERGTSSAHFRKKNFNIKLYKIKNKKESKKRLYITLLGLPKNSTWHLYGGYNDVDKIRNVFSAKIWKESCSKNNKFKIDTGIEYKYLELFKDGKYYGLYALGYPISPKRLNLKKGDYLIKINEWLKMSKKKLENYKYLKASSVVKFGVEQTTIDDVRTNYLLKILSANKNDIENFYKIVDIDNQIDFFLFNNFIQNQDVEYSGNEIKNRIIAYKNNIYYEIPWDFDLTFGSTFWHPEFLDSEMKISRFSITPEGKLFDKINADPNLMDYSYFYSPKIDFITTLVPIYIMMNKNNDTVIKNKLKERYNYLRTHEWSDDNLIKIIDKYEKDIFESGAYKREKETWPLGLYITDENKKLERFKKHVIERAKYLDKSIQNL